MLPPSLAKDVAPRQAAQHWPQQLVPAVSMLGPWWDKDALPYHQWGVGAAQKLQAKPELGAPRCAPVSAGRRQMQPPRGSPSCGGAAAGGAPALLRPLRWWKRDFTLRPREKIAVPINGIVLLVRW